MWREWNEGGRGLGCSEFSAQPAHAHKYVWVSVCVSVCANVCVLPRGVDNYAALRVGFLVSAAC